MEPSKQADQLDHLAEIRTAILERKAERESIEQALLPTKEIRKIKFAQIDEALATLCHPDFDLRSSQAYERGYLFIAVHAEAIKQSISDYLERSFIGKNGISEAAKGMKLNELDAKMMALETEEETLCMTLEAACVDVVRRGDLDPVVFGGRSRGYRRRFLVARRVSPRGDKPLCQSKGAQPVGVHDPPPAITLTTKRE